MGFEDMPLAALAELRVDAKRSEDIAIAHRRAIDTAIAVKLKDREEGTVRSVDGAYEVAVTYKMTRKIDSDALSKSWGELSDNVREAFKWVADLNTKHYRALQELNAGELSEANKYITTSPASPSVTVKVKEE